MDPTWTCAEHSRSPVCKARAGWPGLDQVFVRIEAVGPGGNEGFMLRMAAEKHGAVDRHIATVPAALAFADGIIRQIITRITVGKILLPIARLFDRFSFPEKLPHLMLLRC